MPELPEVETTKKSVDFLIHHKIKNIQIFEPNLREKVNEKILTLINQEITLISRRSKYLIFSTLKGDILFHFGMSGFFSLVEKTEPRKKHDRAEFEFETLLLRFNDVRKFGLIQFFDNALQSKQIQNLGLEPFDSLCNFDYLYQKLRKSNSSIKQSLMNAKIIVGIGNIYASEILFLSKMHPLKKSNQTTLNECKTLINFIKKVLTQAIESGGSSIRDFRQTDGKMGYFQQKLQVYDRLKKPCVVCDVPIEKIVIANRSSYFCPKCQK